MYCSLLRQAETSETPGSSCPSPLTGCFFLNTKCIFEPTIFYSNFLTGLFFIQNVFLNAPYFTQILKFYTNFLTGVFFTQNIFLNAQYFTQTCKFYSKFLTGLFFKTKCYFVQFFFFFYSN